VFVRKAEFRGGLRTACVAVELSEHVGGISDQWVR